MQIEAGDVDGIVSLLNKGFPKRSQQYWTNGLARLRAHAPPDNYSHFGYMLKHGDQPVGVLLLIASRAPGQDAIRVNVSSWFVLDAYRLYAPLLVLKGISRKDASYVNVSPADHTRAIIEAQGFQLAGQGVFAAAPALSLRRTRGELSASPREWESSRTLDSDGLDFLTRHHDFGCICIWCETDTEAQPFIFRERRLRFGGVSCAQLIYAPSRASLEACSGLLGRFLGRRGLGLMLVGSDGPLAGVPGRYFAGRMPVYTKGPAPHRVLDLAYTEAAVFGF